MRGRAAQRCGRHRQRLEDRLGEVLLERHRRGGSDVCRSELDAGVRVDPARARSGDRCVTVEGIAAGVREEVAQRATRLPDFVVEGDGAFLDGDEHRPRGERLGHRGQPERSARVADDVHVAGRVDRCGCDVRDRPRGRQPQRLQHEAVLRPGRGSAAARPRGTRGRGSGERSAAGRTPSGSDRRAGCRGSCRRHRRTR